MFPQGGWETDETVEAAAKRETIEEAGVRGVLEVRSTRPDLHVMRLPSCHGSQPFATARAGR